MNFIVYHICHLSSPDSEDFSDLVAVAVRSNADPYFDQESLSNILVVIILE